MASDKLDNASFKNSQKLPASLGFKSDGFVPCSEYVTVALLWLCRHAVSGEFGHQVSGVASSLFKKSPGHCLSLLAFDH